MPDPIFQPTIIDRSNSIPLESFTSVFDVEPMDRATLELKLRLHGRKIQTGCKNIDTFLQGGIPVNGIAEIAGESGCGKTQICLQLSIMAQYPEEMGGLDAGVIYICTEDAFPSKRFSDLCEEFVKHQPTPPQNIDFGKNVFVIHVFDLKQFEICINEQVPNLISHMKVGLIIIDSIAGIFRYDCDIPWPEKIRIMNIVARKLHDIIDEDYVAVVCVNQVTTEIDSKGTSTLVPSLGESWRRYVLARMQLYRNRDENNRERIFRVTAARDLPTGSCTFTIEPHGII